MGCTKDCGWLADGGKHCELCTSISWSELEESWEIIEFSYKTLVLVTWEEFFVAPGIIGLWILGHRHCQVDTTYSNNIYLLQAWNKLVKLQFTVMTLETLYFTRAEVYILYFSLWDSGYLGNSPHLLEKWKVLTCASCKQAKPSRAKEICSQWLIQENWFKFEQRSGRLQMLALDWLT